VSVDSYNPRSYILLVLYAEEGKQRA